jgi:hypothetical protein
MVISQQEEPKRGNKNNNELNFTIEMNCRHQFDHQNRCQDQQNEMPMTIKTTTHIRQNRHQDHQDRWSPNNNNVQADPEHMTPSSMTEDPFFPFLFEEE